MEVKWEDGQSSIIPWRDLKKHLVPLAVNWEVPPDEELCIWWKGKCHAMKYVCLHEDQPDIITVKQNDSQFHVRLANTWVYRDIRGDANSYPRCRPRPVAHRTAFDDRT